MGSVTIRNLDDAVKHNARLAAAANGRSLEAELRALLDRAYADGRDERTTRIRAMTDGEFIRHLGTVAGNADLDAPARTAGLTRAIFGAD